MLCTFIIFITIITNQFVALTDNFIDTAAVATTAGIYTVTIGITLMHALSDVISTLLIYTAPADTFIFKITAI